MLQKTFIGFLTLRPFSETFLKGLNLNFKALNFKLKSLKKTLEA